MAEITLLFNLKLIDADFKTVGTRMVRAKKELSDLSKYCSLSLLNQLRELFVVFFPQLKKIESFDITFLGKSTGVLLLISYPPNVWNICRR